MLADNDVSPPAPRSSISEGGLVVRPSSLRRTNVFFYFDGDFSDEEQHQARRKRKRPSASPGSGEPGRAPCAGQDVGAPASTDTARRFWAQQFAAEHAASGRSLP